MVIRGKRVRSNGEGVLLGEDDRPLPSRSVSMMKYLPGSSARFVPTMNASVSAWVPVYQLGTRTAFDRSAFNSPKVLYDNRAVGKKPPFCSMTLGTSKIAGWLIVLV